MATFVFNVAKGRAAYLAGLPAANDALVVIPIEAAGVEADATLVDYATVAALLAGASNEQTTLGRKIITATTVTVDNTDDRVDADVADITWTAAAGNPISDLLIAYDPDTTGGDDTTLVPLTWHDFAATPDGTDLVATVPGFYRAQ